MKPTAARAILLTVLSLALLAGSVMRVADAQTPRIDLDVKRAVVRIVPEQLMAAGPRRVEDQPGSGVLIHPSGIVLTAWHVLSQDDNFSQRNYWDDFVVEVIEDDDSLPPVARYRAKIIAVRPQDDLALLRLDRRLNHQPLTPGELTGLAYLPVFTGTDDAVRLLDPGNTELWVLGYPRPFAASGEDSELYIEPVILSSRSRSRGELIAQETFDAGYSGGPVLLEADGRLVVAGIVLAARGSRTVLRDLAERFRGFEWVAGEQRAYAQNIRVAEVVEGNSRLLQFDLDAQSIGLEGAPIQLQINFYDAVHRPWRPGAVGLLLRADGSVYWEEDIRPDRPVTVYPVQVRFALAGLGVAAEQLSFRLMLYDKSSNRQLWSDSVWHQAQPPQTVEPGDLSTATPTPTPNTLAAVEEGVRATLTASAPTATPTATSTRRLPTPTDTPTPNIDAQIATAVAATRTALAPTATSTPTPTDTPTATPTANATATFQAAVQATLTALAPTRTPTPTRRPPTSTPTATPSPTLAAGAVREIDGIPFVYVPAGEFTMGSTEAEVDALLDLCNQSRGDCERAWYENAMPQHTVTLDDFWIGQTEVTNAQYAAFVKAGGYTQPDLWSATGWAWRESSNRTQPGCWDDERWNQPAYPVVCVSWYEAVAYTRWLSEASGVSVRLPTEAEWEKAARGTDGRLWPWGNQPPDGSRLNFCDIKCDSSGSVDDGYPYTAPVGSYPVGASLYGALDMAGNAWEWTSTAWGGCDWPGPGTFAYPYRADDGREDPAGGDCRVLRGGAWGYFHDFAAAAFRFRYYPYFWYFNRGGFRVVVSCSASVPVP